MDLQALFAAPIIAQIPYPAAYADHTNEVWRVCTATEDVVVRVPRAAREWDHAASAFWSGCRQLFGLDPTRPERQAPVNALLARFCPLPVPRFLRAGVVDGRRCIVVERLPGERLLDLRALPPAALRELGAAVARIHRARFAWYGAPAADVRRPFAGFHEHVATTMRALARSLAADDAAVAAPLEHWCAVALRLPAPTSAVPVMIDVDATQFLTDGARVTALIDTDAYAIAPRELDFIGYEYELDAPGAAAFAAGYRMVAPLPELARVRPVYRYLYRLLGTQGAVPLDEWMDWPAWFSAE